MSLLPEMPYPRALVERSGVITTAWRQWLDAVRKRLGDRVAVTVDAAPPTINAGEAWRVDVTIANQGIAPGQAVTAAYSEPDGDVAILAHVSAVDTVTVRFFNFSASPVSLAAGVVTVRVEVS